MNTPTWVVACIFAFSGYQWVTVVGPAFLDRRVRLNSVDAQNSRFLATIPADCQKHGHYLSRNQHGLLVTCCCRKYYEIGWT